MPTETEEAGLVSAIWILSCNDEKSLMLHKSVKHRLGLSDSYNLEELLKKYAELFRLKIPKSVLDDWKKEMLAGNNRPSYIIEIKDKTEREKEISSLKTEDGFRSQFRTVANSPKSDITIINWGLEHIERRRKALIENADNKWKWLNSGVIPVLTILTALTAIIASSWVQIENTDSQERLKKDELTSQEKLKKYEMSFVQRNESYIFAIKSFELITKNVETRNQIDVQINLEQLEASYYRIRPFLTAEAQRRLAETIKNFKDYINDFYNKGSSKKFPLKNQIMYKEFKNYFEEILYKDLFERSDYVSTPITSPAK